METKNDIFDYTPEDLSGAFAVWGEPLFRAGQVFEWIYKGIDSFEQMTNVPKKLRELLLSEFAIGKIECIKKLVSRKDETAKYLFKLDDGNIIESVRMKYKYGYSVCLSTQAGCRMGCEFCASSKIPFSRNLSAGEIIGQLMRIQKDTDDRIGNIVLMGVGEPFDNYRNVIRFMEIAHNNKGLNIGYRKITVSTCGLVSEIIKFMKEGKPVNLSISLHASNDIIRRELMPIAKRYSIDKIIDTCKLYTEETGRRITFEYAMISGINDEQRHARELAEKMKGLLCHVNLIPVNSVKGAGFTHSTGEKAESFKRILEQKGIPVTIRRELGSDIEAACGQLRRKAVEKERMV